MVETITLIGTLNAIGAMYGPIMPVINASGINATIMVNVDINSATRISLMASTMRCFLSPLWVKKRLMLSIPVIGSSTNKPKERISANSVTRLIV